MWDTYPLKFWPPYSQVEFFRLALHQDVVTASLAILWTYLACLPSFLSDAVIFGRFPHTSLGRTPLDTLCVVR